MYAAIRIRGHTEIKRTIEDTMKFLGLTKANTLVIVPESKQCLGMLRKSKDYITFGEISDDDLKEMLKERMPAKGEKIVINLRPPSKGFETIKKAFPKGALGYRGKKISELLKRMV